MAVSCLPGQYALCVTAHTHTHTSCINNVHAAIASNALMHYGTEGGFISHVIQNGLRIYFM